MKRKILTGFALILLTIFPAFSQMMGGGDTGSMMGSDGMGSMMGDGGMGSMMGGHGSAPIRSEQDYISQMIPHHSEATDAAILLFAGTSDQEIRALAQKIYTAQAREIVELKVMYAGQFGILPGAERMTDMRMMRDFRLVTGKARDVQFIQDMIPHHQAAVSMSQDVLALPGVSDEVKAFAQRVIRDQTAEIQTMRAWLAKNR